MQVAGEAQLRVMTRNLFIGVDLVPVMGAQTMDAYRVAVARTVEALQASDFRLRARQIAEELALHQPDLVGLQEVALWQLDPGAAAGVAQDFEQLLLDALEAR